jgi:hypothetical protein
MLVLRVLSLEAKVEDVEYYPLLLLQAQLEQHFPAAAWIRSMSLGMHNHPGSSVIARFLLS